MLILDNNTGRNHFNHDNLQLSAAAESQENQNSLIKQFSDLQIEYNATNKRYKKAVEDLNLLKKKVRIYKGFLQALLIWLHSHFDVYNYMQNSGEQFRVLKLVSRGCTC